MFPTRLILCALVLFCGGAFSVRGKEIRVRPQANSQLYAWFDQLGVEDITHAKLVRVRTGSGVVSSSRNAR